MADEDGVQAWQLEDMKLPHMNLVFIGHVDAGKSTISGNVLVLTGMVDERVIEKYERIAKEKNRTSWFLAFIMDENEEERAKGKTVEVGRAYFKTQHRRFTIMDAPGHKNYVPNMIGGASQADVAVLVISARRGEFETGFEGGGQTREHAMLAKTLGVDKLIVVVNKMDESTVEWSEARYKDIQVKLTPFLKSVGFKPSDVTFLPASGFTGENIKDKVESSVCSWYKDKTLLEIFDTMDPPERDVEAAMRMPLLDKFRDGGKNLLLGKVESGKVSNGQDITFEPGGITGKVTSIFVANLEVEEAGAGENIRLCVSGVSDEHIVPGSVMCGSPPVATVERFEAEIMIMDLPESKPVFSTGYSCIMHIHSVVVEVSVGKLVESKDAKTKKVTKNPKFALPKQRVRVKFKVANPVGMCRYKELKQLGRFTLRDEALTIALGKVINYPESQ